MLAIMLRTATGRQAGAEDTAEVYPTGLQAVSAVHEAARTGNHSALQVGRAREAWTMAGRVKGGSGLSWSALADTPELY